MSRIKTPVKVGKLNVSGIGVYDADDKILLTVHWVADPIATVEDAIALAQTICADLNYKNHAAESPFNGGYPYND